MISNIVSRARRMGLIAGLAALVTPSFAALLPMPSAGVPLPGVAGSPSGLVMNSVTRNFLIETPAGAVIGRGRMVDTVINSGGRQVYYTQIYNDVVSAVSITHFTRDNFRVYSIDAGYRTDLGGTVAAATGSRNAGGQLVRIDFAAPIAPGQWSRPVYFYTSAPAAIGFTNNGETLAYAGGFGLGRLDTFEPN